MRLGLFSVVDHYPAELGRATGDFYAELLEQAEAADEWGFDSFWVAEHHFHEYGAVPRPPVLLAAAAQRTRLAHQQGERHDRGGHPHHGVKRVGPP